MPTCDTQRAGSAHLKGHRDRRRWRLHAKNNARTVRQGRPDTSP